MIRLSEERDCYIVSSLYCLLFEQRPRIKFDQHECSVTIQDNVHNVQCHNISRHDCDQTYNTYATVFKIHLGVNSI